MITVVAVDDILGEGNEIVVLELLTNVNGNVISVDSRENSTVIIIIEDDSK